MTSISAPGLSVPIGVIFYLDDGTIHSCNADASAILGYTVEQIVGASSLSPPWQTICEDGSPFLPKDYPATISVGTGQPCADVVMGFYKPDGRLIWLSIAAEPLFKANSASAYGAEVTFREIGEPNRYEQNGREQRRETEREISHQIFSKRQAAADSPSSQANSRKLLTVLIAEDCVEDRKRYQQYLQTDADCEYRFVVAESVEEMLERCQQCKPDVVLLSCLLPMDGAQWWSLWQEDGEDRPPVIALTGQGEDSIAAQLLKRGTAAYLSKEQLNADRLRLEMKRAIAEHQLRLQHQAALAELNQQEARLQLASEAADLGMWFWDLTTDCLEWTQQCTALLGLTSDVETSYDVFLSAVHPEDRDRTHAAVQASLASRSEYSVEYRTVRDDGSVHWLFAKGRGWYGSNGEPLQMMGTVQDITERKLAEQKVQRSEKHLRRILDSLFTFVGVLDPNGILIEVNRPALKVANLQLEDVVGKPFADAYWWSYSAKSQALLNDSIERVKSGESVRYDVAIRLSESDYIWIDFALVPLFDEDGQLEYIIPSGIDISDRRQAAKAIRDRERELRLMADVIPQQIWTAIPSGETDYFNQRWQDYTGLTVGQARSRGWEYMIHPDDLEEVNQMWQRCFTTGCNYNLETRLRRADGKFRWFLVKARPLHNQKGEIVKWYGTNTNIHQIKQLEAKLQQQTEDLTQANQLKDEFLAIVSHELRTPLNPILGWSNLLLAGKLDSEKASQGVGIIQRNAKLQAQLIDDLLDVSRILRGKLNLRATPLPLDSIIRLAISTVQLAAAAKSIEITTHFDPDVGQILGDAGRLQQIVWNLLSNAIKFTPEGGQVSVTLEQAGTHAVIQVADTGKGIEPEFLPYVFERFRQEESSSTRNFGGLGLGLAIVRHLTELHGGTVTADSSGEGQGSAFSVKLPLIEASITEQTEPAKSTEVALGNQPLKGVRALIVDDVVDSLNLLTLVLEQEGATVEAVVSASAGMAAFIKSTPDLIISDIGMPDVDGYAFLTQIRAMPQGKHVPAIALTAYVGEIDKQRSIGCGYQQHVSKPIDPAELIPIILSTMHPV
ncbi:MAG: PAS domain S-box protein [Cyanobacteria bacterium P01_D01_bin.1]